MINPEAKIRVVLFALREVKLQIEVLEQELSALQEQLRQERTREQTKLRVRRHRQKLKISA